MDLLDWILECLHEQDIPFSEIMVNIIDVVKDPTTRNAQKWMADPLFNEIVIMLNERI